jgi:hypothetical protein
MRNLLAVVALLASATVAFAADPVGSYSIVGTNPGSGSQYRGTAKVERTGKTYRVTWVVGGTRYVGTGIGNHEGLAVSYKSGNSSGLALYGADGGNWEGVWTYSGGRDIGTEVWKRQ